jgi:cyclase
MLKARVIPCLQLIDQSLVKTQRFKNPAYIGDPINTIRIFNELEVDELCFLDIRATLEKRPPNFNILSEIANECFMPLSYGGGINHIDTVKKILAIGFEKVVINSNAFIQKNLLIEVSGKFGNQSIIGSMDVKKNLFGKHNVFINSGTKKINLDPIEWAQELVSLGAGELLITSMDNEGTWEGYDIDIIKKISNSVSVPVIANGGAGTIKHIADAINLGQADAVALGSMVVYQKKGMGVLVNFPDKNDLATALQ